MDLSALGLLRFGANKIPDFDPRYCYCVQWLYEEDNRPVPSEQIFDTARDAITAMIGIVNASKTLVHISMSRRNA